MKTVAAFLMMTGAAMAQPLDLPSGTQAVLHEVLIDTVSGENWLRFRLVAPAIDAKLEHAPDYVALEGDFPHLCAAVALPYIADFELAADKIAISLSDRIVEFGTTDPDATQYFELFRHEGGTCIWEAF